MLLAGDRVWFQAYDEEAEDDKANRRGKRLPTRRCTTFRFWRGGAVRSVGRGCVFFRFAAAEMESASKGEQADPPAPSK